MIEKFKKETFNEPQHLLGKKLISLTNKAIFTNRELINKQMVIIIKYFAKKFTNNDMKKAKQRLDIHAEILRKKDTAILSYFIGYLSVMVPMIIALLITKLDEDNVIQRDN